MNNSTATGSSGIGLPIGAIQQLLAADGAILYGDPSVEIDSVFQDSRLVQNGSLFAARAGAKADGVKFVEAAIARGARAVLVERGTAEPAMYPAWAVPVIEVEAVRGNLSKVAEAVYGQPSRSLPLVGITGTNGKTTTALLVERALLAAHKKPGRLGTVGSSFDGVETESSLTTPEADELSRFLAKVRDANGTHVVMEVSSHSIAQGRVSGLRFDVAAFTNLTQDHLDFHGSMAAYAAEKLRLFTEFAPRASVLNVLNQTGRDFAKLTRSERILQVGIDADCDVYPDPISCDAHGLRGMFAVEGRRIPFATRFVGEHNVENLLVATGILACLDVDLELAISGWSDFGVPGRLERCDVPEDGLVVLVDYAHTPDALERALAAVRPLTTGRVHCVFGCGGDRDPTKRPKMGAAVGRLADRVVVTNDNPRTEQPESIAQAIELGLREVGARYEVILDRAQAIEVAISSAKAGEVVLLAGKGHEPYQIIGTTKRAFDDRVEAKRALALRRRSGGC